MFNEKRKYQYADHCITNGDTRSIRYYEVMFEYCEEFEYEFGKDLCEFSDSEIAEMYGSHHKFRTLNILIVKQSQYRRYADWANENNCFRNFKREDLVQFVNIEDRDKRIITRDELMGVVNSMINCMDKLLILSIFEGLKGRNFQDLLGITIHDVNFERSFVVVKSRKGIVEISRELNDIIRKCLLENIYVDSAGHEFVYENSEYVYKYRSLIDDIRSVDPDDASHKLRVHYAWINADTRLRDISVVDLQESGKIWYICSSAEEEGITPLEYLDKRSTSKELCRQFGMNFYRKGLFLKKYRDFLE